MVALIPILGLTTLPAQYASAYPGIIDGAALKSYLESAQRVHTGRAHGDDISHAQFVYGYLVGIVDALNNDRHFFCQPLSVSKEKDAEIVLKHMETNPAMEIMGLHENATLYVIDALGIAFPRKT